MEFLLATTSQPVEQVESPPKYSAPGHGRMSVWTRLLAPSFSDCFFIALIAWLFLYSPEGWKVLLADADAGWHIRTGEFILDHRTIPSTDLYSFSKPGQPWFAWEWLSDVIYALAFRQWGLKGVVLLAGVVIALYATLLLRWMLWRKANLFVSLAVGLLGVGASSIHFLARPHVFTLLLLTVCLWLVDCDRRAPGRAVWLLIPLTVVWTNLHGGFLALIACLVLLTVGSAIEGFWVGGGWQVAWRAPRRYALLTAACSAASLVNPFGTKLHAHIAAYLRSDWIRNAIQEFQSPSFRSENMVQFEILMFLGLVTVALLVRRREVMPALWIVYFAHMSLGSVRHVPLFVIAAAPLVASEITACLKLLVERASPKSVLGILDQLANDMSGAFRRSSVWGAVLVLSLMWIEAPVRWPSDFPDRALPVNIVHRHMAEIVDSRVFTTDQWADYLIYTFYPRQRVFFDGRSDFYGEKLGEEYMAVIQGKHNWESILDRYGFGLVLVPVDSAVAQLLKLKEGWVIVEDDHQAILFRRSGGTRAALGVFPPYFRSAWTKETLSKGLMKTTVAAEIYKGDPTV